MTTPKAYNHREAFCLMLYRDLAGDEELIWNNRDGSVPFMVTSRSGLESRHRFGRDVRPTNHIPKAGDRIFVDQTPEQALDLWRAYVDRMWDVGTVGDRWCDKFSTRDAAAHSLYHQDITLGGGRPSPALIEVK